MAKRNKQQQRELKKQSQSEAPSEPQNQPQNQPESQPDVPQKPKNKRWKKVGIFASFEAASKIKTELLDKTKELDVKIRRCGPEGSQFQVKTRNQ